MNLENTIFKATFDYRVKLVNDWIRIIKTTECQKREEAFKIVVFKMMKDMNGDDIVDGTADRIHVKERSVYYFDFRNCRA